MYYHYILMFSDYEQGTRKAYYKTFVDVKEMRKFRDEIKQIKGDFRNVTFSSHQVMTNSEQISSVSEYDRYFEGVEFYSEKELFERELGISTEITPSDILKYVLIEKECTKLKAMKLIYLIYERYLKETGKFLFKEDFLAWKLGPVSNSAYLKLSAYKYEDIKLEDKELEKAKLKLKLDRAFDKDRIIRCMDNVIKEFGDLSPNDLVNLTHEKERPWYKVKKSIGLGHSITKDVMLECVLINH
ncbi:Panacea domain-containing protein [Clostridium perfringens]|uniref:Panacea domain-containing protein n=1 Tax=Clostridium perfringens TaxID=1502 RepID=UPI0022463BA3|nr:type II toxin-antitoxin system antitoxin SocA domain-containing protein [Clostridium perfringens]MCX0403430.1 DUF4065 domain-containing protein [Clostridium perfringens]